MTRRRPSAPPPSLPTPRGGLAGAAGWGHCGPPGRESAAGQASGKRWPRSGRVSDKRPLSLAALTTTLLTPTPKLGTGWGGGKSPWRRQLLTWSEGKGALLSLPKAAGASWTPEILGSAECRGAGHPGLHGQMHTDLNLDLGSSAPGDPTLSAHGV